MARRGGFPGGMPGNMNNLMKQAQRMQRQMEENKKALEEKEFTASAGGGAVEVVINGKKELKSLTISPDAVDPDDVEMLQDMIDALILARLLVGGQVPGVLHHHDGAVISVRVSANRAHLFVGQVLAHLTVGHMLLGVYDSIRKMLHSLGRHSDNIKSEALCRFVSNSGQRRQLID